MGPYYAMFPIPFVSEVTRLFAKPGNIVIDPFCGRGTTPFIAMINGIMAIAADINPVAWIYSKTKTDPHPSLDEVKRRIEQIREAVTPHDHQAEHEFQELAFCPDVLAFINVSRRELNWRTCQLDRTVAAFLIQHLHDKIGHGLSNQMRHSVPCRLGTAFAGGAIKALSVLRKLRRTPSSNAEPTGDMLKA